MSNSNDNDRQQAVHDVSNQNERDTSVAFTVDIKSQVEHLITTAKKQCDREKALIHEKYNRDISNLKSQVMAELNKAFEKNLVVPLRTKISENENEIRALRRDLLASRTEEEKLQKEKNAQQNTINILKLRVEKLEGQVGNQGYSKSEIPTKVLEQPEPVDISSVTTFTKPPTLSPIMQQGPPETVVIKAKNDYEKNKKNSAVISDKNGVAAALAATGSENLIDTKTVILHLEFPIPQPGNADDAMQSNVILYNKASPEKREIKTVAELRAISEAYTKYFASEENLIATANEIDDVGHRLKLIDKQITDLQKVYSQGTAQTKAAMITTEAKYCRASDLIRDEVAYLRDKIEQLVNTIQNNRSKHSLRQLNLTTSHI